MQLTKWLEKLIALVEPVSAQHEPTDEREAARREKSSTFWVRPRFIRILWSEKPYVVPFRDDLRLLSLAPKLTSR